MSEGWQIFHVSGGGGGGAGGCYKEKGFAKMWNESAIPHLFLWAKCFPKLHQSLKPALSLDIG